MNRIKILSKEISDKIAAGEVIEAPVSVVKELMENALDAGARSLVVEIKTGGKDYIRVSDDGCGINKEDLKLALIPHATSKIYFEKDLNNIQSLGFRGEALSSISAVSKFEIISKTEEESIGSRLYAEASEILSIEDYACENGTTIIVKDLFYNLPVRKKFMKADSREASSISDLVSKMALAYPEVKIRFINNGTILFSTQGKNDVYGTILTVYSPQNAKKLLPLSKNGDGISAKGYVSSPLESRVNKKQQIFFVNGRLIESKLLDRAVSDAYSDKLFQGRYPSVYLFLNISPSKVDVNIHPRKAELKFLDEDTVYSFVYEAIRAALLNKDATKLDNNDIKDSKTAKPILSAIPVTIETKPEPVSVCAEPVITYTDSIFKNLREESLNTEKAEQIVFEEFTEYNELEKLLFRTLTPLAQVFTTYILASDSENFYIIDQHAAHERIMFEKFLKQFNTNENAGQILLTPIVLDLSPTEMLTVDESIPLLNNLGFVLEEFGSASFVVKEIPVFMDFSEAEDFIKSFFETSVESRNNIQAKKDSIISASCKAAVKAHDKLSFAEMNALFEQLDKCDNPYSCPHGRPTFLKLSEYEFEKMFKRK